MIDWQGQKFHPVIHLPKNYEVYDFSQGYDPDRSLSSDYGIGKFNEKRPGMYAGEQFQSNKRDIHMGVDIAAPVGTEVFAVSDGEIFCVANNAQEFDYGFTIITHHQIEGESYYILLGHLSSKSIANKKPGDKFSRGDVLAWVGDKNENGGWNPHLHFQISLQQPVVCDMPGAVGEQQLVEALKVYVDPQNILGPLY